MFKGSDVLLDCEGLLSFGLYFDVDLIDGFIFAVITDFMKFAFENSSFSEMFLTDGFSTEATIYKTSYHFFFLISSVSLLQTAQMKRPEAYY